MDFLAYCYQHSLQYQLLKWLIMIRDDVMGSLIFVHHFATPYFLPPLFYLYIPLICEQCYYSKRTTFP
jgi:hypothetical protein